MENIDFATGCAGYQFDDECHKETDCKSEPHHLKGGEE